MRRGVNTHGFSTVRFTMLFTSRRILSVRAPSNDVTTVPFYWFAIV